MTMPPGAIPAAFVILMAAQRPEDQLFL